MYHYNCDTCEFRLDIDFIPRVYVLEDGRQLNMQQRHVWCTQCNCVTVAESLVESAGKRQWFRERYEMQRQKLASSDLEDIRERVSTQKSIEAMDRYQQLLKEWQSIRIREPFCLRCGNSQISIPESEFSSIPHPTCGGQLECNATIQGGTYVSPEPHKYSIEGEFIEPGYHRGFIGDKLKPLDLWWPTTT